MIVLACAAPPSYILNMTTNSALEDLLADFAFLDDWEDRYMHVIELGKAMPPFDDADRTAANKVKGCVSQVWLRTDITDETPPILHFRGDSDAHIVKGLVAIVLKMFSGRTAPDIAALDANSILTELGLAEHLSPQRANGLSAMVTRIKAEARAI